MKKFLFGIPSKKRLVTLRIVFLCSCIFSFSLNATYAISLADLKKAAQKVINQITNTKTATPAATTTTPATTTLKAEIVAVPSATTVVPVKGSIPSGNFTTAEIIKKNIARYRDYRNRYRNNFIFISANDEPGSDFAANKRNAYGKNSKHVNFGDNTAGLGFQLGMLATEYKLLKDEKADTTQTVKELYYTLKAINRLDMSAESYFGGKNTLNGFFIRDDVPSFYYPTYKPGNPEIQFIKDHFSGMTRNGYDYGGVYEKRLNEMSQDQVRGMTFGLALVKKYVTDDLVIDGKKVNLKTMSQDITYRIIKYMQSMKVVTQVVKNPLCQIKGLNMKTCEKTITLSTKQRRIKNPVTGKLVLRGDMATDDGGIAIFSYGFAKVGSWITDKDMTRKENVDPEREASYQFFNLLGKGTLDVVYNNKKTGSDEYSALILGIVGNIRGSKSIDAIYNNFLVRNRYEWMAMLSNALHGNTSDKLSQLKNVYAKQLSQAPDNGPWNYGGKDRSESLDWTSESLLRYPEKRGEIAMTDGNGLRGKAGEFNGLDYMLLNNLFLITYKSQLSGFKYAK